MGKAILRISYDALYHLLGLPAGGEICRTWPSGPDESLNCLHVMIDHNDLYPVREGELVPPLIPQYERKEHWVFKDWGKH